ncbi:hypothetical protein [Candidatus Parabeggiatoa sp. HSG14]|uniref:type II toxin-antitoxin system VapC family toxin n=1 Tax=Candidatus Parabeggiatoa sp. HSG14 TaxID=3055593 RepID=UPI0025A7DE12|nr:hypothetical protein [Thiotrichales bacterium HSG14]
MPQDKNSGMGAIYGKWPGDETEILKALIELNLEGIIDNYAQIDYFLEKKIKPAHPMGQNDMWIAATATTLGAWLMTTDNDFDHFPNLLKESR